MPCRLGLLSTIFFQNAGRRRTGAAAGLADSVGTRVLVRLTETRVTIFADGEEIASHPRARGKGEDVTDPVHYPETKRVSSHEIHRQRVLDVREAGPHAARFLRELRDGPWGFGDQLAQVARLLKAHGPSALDRACECQWTPSFTKLGDVYFYDPVLVGESGRSAEGTEATSRPPSRTLADQTTEERIAELIEPDLLILDELGFTPLNCILADAFYRVVASRYEQASTIVTSNKSFESGPRCSPDPVIASAVLDRLVHHAHLVPILGESYRMKDLKKDKKGGKAASKA